MAEASISVDQDQFSCPICLDLLKDPAAIPCGHSFCMVCINDCWDQGDQRGVYSCPLCRETFSPRPVLRRNNMLAEVVEKLKKTEIQPASPAHCYARPGDLECDFCIGRKCKAMKSCLVCKVSLCETHLKPHLELPALKKHKLVKSSTELQEKICSQHDKVIEIYCRTDQSCICYLCTMDEHKGHDTVSAAAEVTQKQTQLNEVRRKTQQRIQEKEKKIQELKRAVNTLKRSAQTVVKESERIYTELICSIEKMRNEVKELIRAKERAELSRAEGLLDKLEQEIVDLKRRDTELEHLSHTEDPIHFLKHFQSVCKTSECEESLNITMNQCPSYDGVRKSLSRLKTQLENFCKEEFKRIPLHGNSPQSSLFKIEFECSTRTRLSEQMPGVHHGFKCSNCLMNPIQGPRFKSQSANMNLCQRCYQKRIRLPLDLFDRFDKPNYFINQINTVRPGDQLPTEIPDVSAPSTKSKQTRKAKSKWFSALCCAGVEEAVRQDLNVPPCGRGGGVTSTSGTDSAVLTTTARTKGQTAKQYDKGGFCGNLWMGQSSFKEGSSS
ncbi:E3 ubiquitin-protein ligase TRIM47-like isoform X2 [Electrophorus electricus]|uniref:E3 ubiquitin-protein ligase TRIM47-like isoform X2 n=1 Tax=Electrophorus electricus TaxID=8005 RepID=UPI0015CFE134|nr:E3 ubiquitin-protein ligase TRIM47-like isoform X2 [Electrophorus electricus]